MARVAPRDRFRAELDEALAGVGQERDPVETIGRLGARLILQQALEDEVSEFLGRARYERAEETVSHRNGYERRRVRTTSGTVELERPRVRNASKLGFESWVLGKHVTRTWALESLVIGSFLRGLSTPDVEAVLEEDLRGADQLALDGVAHPRGHPRALAALVRAPARRARRRPLLPRPDYLKLHPDDEPAEGVLVAWGVTLEGRKVLLGLALRSRESYESWLAFGRDLIDRGLRSPALIVADGAPGLWKAVQELWPVADEQRCTVHALRNVTAKLPERHHRELKARWWKLFDEATSAADARRGLEAIIADYRSAYPSAMAVIERDLDALVAHLRWPTEHRKRIRTTNLLERTFVEVRRRTKVIGRFPGETSALSLIWAVLELSSRGWRGVVMTPKTVAEVERLRHHGTSGGSDRMAAAEEVVAA
jgi:putative transposase